MLSTSKHKKFLKDSDLRIYKKLKEGSVCVRDYQIDHCLKLVNILQKNRGYIDTSKMGLGKTYMTIAVAMYYKCPLLVIGPRAAEDVWKSAVEESGAKLIDFISKDALRSKRGHQPKHGYLIRNDSGRGVKFMVTEKFKNFVSKGGFVVVDECQFVRNSTSAQHKATKVLINHLVFEGGKSRFALLSASPLTEIDQIVSLLRMIGYIRSTKLYYRDRNGSVILKGLQELIVVCEMMDREKTNEISKSVKYYNSRTVKKMVHKLFCDVIKYHISSAALPPPLKVNVDQKNGYYKTDEKTRNEFIRNLHDLEVAVKYERDTDEADRQQLVKTNIIYKRRKTELIKASTFARLAKEQLMNDPNCKVIIGVHYLDTLKVLKDSLKDFSPIVLQGSVKGKDAQTGEHKRSLLVKEFQTNPKKRLIIAIVKVISVSISLHDTVGNAPRVMFLSPSYELLQMYQATGRILRDGNSTKSDATIRFVYLQGGELETAIMNALARKSIILKDTLVQPHDIRLPGDYETYIEN